MVEVELFEEMTLHKDLIVKITLGGEKGMGNGLEKGRNQLGYLRTNRKTNVTTWESARQR